jgi:glycerol-3-phosphate acyltransferase PlsX
MIIAVDADGGDYAPREIVKGALDAASEYQIDIALLGKRAVLDMLVRRYSKKENCAIIETGQTITCEEQPVQAVRKKQDSSIVVGTKLVKDGFASAFVSAGNTGAVLAAAYLMLGQLPDIQRPALCSVIHIIPSSPFLLLDVGANVDCKASFLVQFGRLGSAFARGLLDMENPRVALLNNGVEEVKGNSLMKETYKLLKQSGMNFIGNIEGQDLLQGKADVVVTDGFTGNIVLKSIEGFADIFQNMLGIGQSFNVDRHLQGSALVHYIDLTSMIKRMDYKEYGGACLLGVRGNVVVAHGRSHASAIKNAIQLARRAEEIHMVDTIKHAVSYKV